MNDVEAQLAKALAKLQYYEALEKDIDEAILEASKQSPGEQHTYT